jgi:hypothetical protein
MVAARFCEIDGRINGARRSWPNELSSPELHLVPFTKNVEWTIPGKFLYYATAMPRRSGGIPLIATTVDGRPIKLEGNPLHPASGGTRTRLSRRQFSIFTIRPARNVLSRKGRRVRGKNLRSSSENLAKPS